MKRIFAFFNTALLLACLFAVSMANDGTWELKQGNPSRFTTAYDISVGYTDIGQKYIFVAESSATSNLRYSTDEGSSWTIVKTVQNHYFRHVLIQAEDFGNGWALVPGLISDNVAGPYWTEDGGATWQRRVAGLGPNVNLLALASLPSTDMSVAYVGGVSNSDNSHQMLFKWTGTTWTATQNGLPTSYDGVVNDISVYADFPNLMVCAYDEGAGTGVYKSIDGGTSWNTANLNGFTSVSAVCIGHGRHDGIEIWPVSASALNSTTQCWEIQVTDDIHSPDWSSPSLLGYGDLQFSETHCIRTPNGYNFYGAFETEPCIGLYPWVISWPPC